MHPTLPLIARSMWYFLLAGLSEIGGGYLVWIWLREDHSFLYGVLGGFVLFLYGVIPTFQKTHFHRIYGAYGGVFVVMSLVWGWIFEGTVPDLWDTIGGVVVVAGVFIMFYWPRNEEAVHERIL